MTRILVKTGAGMPEQADLVPGEFAWDGVAGRLIGKTSDGNLMEVSRFNKFIANEPILASSPVALRNDGTVEPIKSEPGFFGTRQTVQTGEGGQRSLIGYDPGNDCWLSVYYQGFSEVRIVKGVANEEGEIIWGSPVNTSMGTTPASLSYDPNTGLFVYLGHGPADFIGRLATIDCSGSSPVMNGNVSAGTNYEASRAFPHIRYIPTLGKHILFYADSSFNLKVRAVTVNGAGSFSQTSDVTVVTAALTNGTAAVEASKDANEALLFHVTNLNNANPILRFTPLTWDGSNFVAGTQGTKTYSGGSVTFVGRPNIADIAYAQGKYVCAFGGLAKQASPEVKALEVLVVETDGSSAPTAGDFTTLHTIQTNGQGFQRTNLAWTGVDFLYVGRDSVNPARTHAATFRLDSNGEVVVETAYFQLNAESFSTNDAPNQIQVSREVNPEGLTLITRGSGTGLVGTFYFPYNSIGPNNVDQFVGFAQSGAGEDESVDVGLPGQVVMLSGLDAGTTYYLDNDGELTDVLEEGRLLVGYAMTEDYLYMFPLVEPILMDAGLNSFRTSPIDVVRDGDFTVAHPLGDLPQEIFKNLICIDDDGNFDAGDVIPAGVGVSIKVNATHIIGHFADAANVFSVVDPVSNTSVDLDNDKWKLVIKLR